MFKKFHIKISFDVFLRHSERIISGASSSNAEEIRCDYENDRRDKVISLNKFQSIYREGR